LNGSVRAAKGVKKALPILLLGLLVFPALVLTEAKTQYWFQVGAWGDSGSKGNNGVQAEIRTKLQPVLQPDSSDAFWVADNLQNGAFIQFGYLIEPGNHCIRGQVLGGKSTCTGPNRHDGSSDAYWFWQYWPDRHGADYYYAVGPIGSVGPDGSWHTYTITPNAAGSWNFIIDGQQVDHVSFTWTSSEDAVYVAAEKVTSSDHPSSLGPAEFRNIAYLMSDGWHQVNSLYVLRRCGYGSACVADIPYGVQMMGPNHIIAGTGAAKVQDGKLLWGTLTLTVTAPLNAHVFVDGVGGTISNMSLCGCIQIPLQAGWHQVTINQFIQIYSKARLRFSNWDDGSASLTISRFFDSDVTLEAKYVMQYLVSIDSGFSSKTDAWRDKDSTTFFSLTTGTERPMEGPLGVLGGKWVFTGWYEDGSVATTSSTVSVHVDGPHTLAAQWQPDVVTPVLILILFVCAAGIATWLLYRRRKAPELKGPDRIYCINCGAELTPGSKFCNECGSAQT
jgi:uncharacterized repeat protein (TIGR02543 family)